MIPGDAYEVPPNGGGDFTHDESPNRTAGRRLQHAFARHSDRDEFADCGRVVVRDCDAGRYEYVDGVHYVTDVDRRARERIEAFVDRRGLEVVMDGHAGFAFEHPEPNLAADVHAAGVIVEVAFDVSFEELTDVVEVLDATTHVSWTETEPRIA